MKRPWLLLLIVINTLFNYRLCSADVLANQMVLRSSIPGFVNVPGGFTHRHHHHHRQQQCRQRSVPNMEGREMRKKNSVFLQPVSTLFLLRPQDNLVSGLCEISFAFSLGVLWSEYSIVQTGCGPVHFSDSLERLCYQGLLASAGIAWFTRIVTGGNSLEVTAANVFGPLQESTLIQLRVVEIAMVLAVLGAFLALGLQEYRGTNMDGLSGINVDMCRAIRNMT
jgi:hypothetical protein